MLTARIHLDAAGAAEGGLAFVKGSHLRGRMSEAEIDAEIDGAATSKTTSSLEVPRGAVQLFRPLLVHGSPRRKTPGKRRVLQIEFAGSDLPAPLEWKWKVR